MERLPPPANELALRLATAQAKRPDRRLGPGEVRAARSALVAEPLAYEPFFVTARAAEQAGRYADATRLMEEVRRRRPSYPPGRLFLMSYYARAGRYAEALAEADVAMRLSPEAHRNIVPVLADMLPYPEARAGLARSLAQDPVWRADFVDIARRKARPEHAAALLDELRRLKPASGTAAEAGLLVESLVRAGRYGEARRVWLALVPPADRSRAGTVFDGDFAGSAAPPPFNWSFATVSGGRAEIARAAGGEPAHLSVSYFGSEPVSLAEQTLVLAPGSYVLSVAAKGDRDQISGQIFWRVSCLATGAELGLLRLQSFRGSYARVQLPFAVPPGCGAQRLSVGGAAGDLPQPVNAAFSQLRIKRRG